jgi:hypothetical protein
MYTGMKKTRMMPRLILPFVIIIALLATLTIARYSLDWKPSFSIFLFAALILVISFVPLIFFLIQKKRIRSSNDSGLRELNEDRIPNKNLLTTIRNEQVGSNITIINLEGDQMPERHQLIEMLSDKSPQDKLVFTGTRANKHEVFIGWAYIKDLFHSIRSGTERKDNAGSDSSMHTERIDTEWQADDQLTAYFKTKANFIAITENDKYSGLVSRNRVMNGMLGAVMGKVKGER